MKTRIYKRTIKMLSVLMAGLLAIAVIQGANLVTAYAATTDEPSVKTSTTETVPTSTQYASSTTEETPSDGVQVSKSYTTSIVQTIYEQLANEPVGSQQTSNVDKQTNPKSRSMTNTIVVH